MTDWTSARERRKVFLLQQKKPVRRVRRTEYEGPRRTAQAFRNNSAISIHIIHNKTDINPELHTSNKTSSSRGLPSPADITLALAPTNGKIYPSTSYKPRSPVLNGRAEKIQFYGSMFMCVKNPEVFQERANSISRRICQSFVPPNSETLGAHIQNLQSLLII